MGKKRVAKKKRVSKALTAKNKSSKAEKIKLKPKNHSKRSRKNTNQSFWKNIKNILIPKHSPLGIKVLMIYFIFMFFLYLFYFFVGIDFPVTILLSKMIQGGEAVMLNLLLLIILGSFIYGTLKRKKWAFPLGVLWLVSAIINSMVSAFFMRKPVFEIMQKFTMLSFLSVLLINSIIIWYMLKEKSWWLEKKIELKEITANDRMFVCILVGFWAVVIVAGSVMGARAFNDSKQQINTMMLSMISKEYQEAITFCESKQGNEKDICYIVLATIKHIDTKNDITMLCSRVDSNFYRFTCYRAAS